MYWETLLDSKCFKMLKKNSIFRTLSPRPLVSFTSGHNFVKILMLVQWWITGWPRFDNLDHTLNVNNVICHYSTVQLLTSIFNRPPTNPPCTVQMRAKSTLARPSSPSTHVTVHSFFFLGAHMCRWKRFRDAEMMGCLTAFEDSSWGVGGSCEISSGGLHQVRSRFIS